MVFHSINSSNKYSRSYLLGKLKFKNNANISYTDFKEGINNLIATNNFETFRYYLEKNTYSKTCSRVECPPSPVNNVLSLIQNGRQSGKLSVPALQKYRRRGLASPTSCWLCCRQRGEKGPAADNNINQTALSWVLGRAK